MTPLGDRVGVQLLRQIAKSRAPFEAARVNALAEGRTCIPEAMPAGDGKVPFMQPINKDYKFFVKADIDSFLFLFMDNSERAPLAPARPPSCALPSLGLHTAA